MRTAVVYASKKGYVKEAAELIKEGLGDQADLFDVSAGKPDSLNEYDNVVFAASIRAGKFPGGFTRLCQKHVPLLKDCKLILLVSGLDEKSYNETAERNLTTKVKEHFQNTYYIGGRFIPEQNGRFFRMIMAKINKSEGPVLNEKMDVVDALIKDLIA